MSSPGTSQHFKRLGDMTDVNDTEQVPWQDVMDTVTSILQLLKMAIEIVIFPIKDGDFP